MILVIVVHPINTSNKTISYILVLDFEFHFHSNPGISNNNSIFKQNSIYIKIAQINNKITMSPWKLFSKLNGNA